MCGQELRIQIRIPRDSWSSTSKLNVIVIKIQNENLTKIKWLKTTTNSLKLGLIPGQNLYFCLFRHVNATASSVLVSKSYTYHIWHGFWESCPLDLHTQRWILDPLICVAKMHFYIACKDPMGVERSIVICCHKKRYHWLNTVFQIISNKSKIPEIWY